MVSVTNAGLEIAADAVGWNPAAKRQATKANPKTSVGNNLFMAKILAYRINQKELAEPVLF